MIPTGSSSTAVRSLLAAAVLQALDLTVATVALPAIQRSPGFAGAESGWVLTSYIVAMALMTPVAGQVSTALGRRRALMLAIGGVTLASLCCSLATSFSVLLAARLVQGAAAGIILPLVQATLLDIMPKAEHGRAMSLLGAAIMIGPVFGPAIGGPLVDMLGWRVAFLINVPVGIFALAGCIAGLRELPVEKAARLDLMGLAIFGAGVVALQLLLDRGNARGWLGSREIDIYAAIAVGGLGAALLRAAHRSWAFPALELFRERNFAVTSGCGFIAGCIIYGSILLVPGLLQNGFGHDATAAGLAMAPRGIGTMMTMLSISRRVGAIDHRILLLAGCALNALAFAGFSVALASWGVMPIAALSFVQGVGVGLVFTPLSTAAFSFLAPQRRADATGLYSLLRYIGGGVGLSLLTGLLHRGPAAGEAVVSTYRTEFLLLIGLVIAMSAVIPLIRTHPAGLPRTPAPPRTPGLSDHAEMSGGVGGEE